MRMKTPPSGKLLSVGLCVAALGLVTSLRAEEAAAALPKMSDLSSLRVGLDTV